MVVKIASLLHAAANGCEDSIVVTCSNNSLYTVAQAQWRPTLVVGATHGVMSLCAIAQQGNSYVRTYL